MKSMLLSTDVLAVLSVKEFIFIGMGYTLYIYKKSTSNLEVKLNVTYPDKIHGIVEGPECKIAVFGGKSLCILEFCLTDNIIKIKKFFVTHRFPDWIIAVGWFEEKNDVQLSILFAHNNVYVYNISKKQYQNVWCKEKCILYGGSIFSNNINNVIIFSGTVFQEILIWTLKTVPNYNEDAPVLHRLKGHNGVILSVTYDPFTNLICSTSDDRTIRLWKVQNNFASENNRVKWEDAKIILMTTMFGHIARVWRAMIREHTVVSIGEDSLMCIWSIDGRLLKKIEAHHGASIWSIDISKDNNTIITGGSNGAVVTWPFNYNEYPEVHLKPENDGQKISKLSYLKKNALVALMEGGKLLRYESTKENYFLRQSIDLPRYASYCVMQVSPNRTYVGLASKDGYITIYQDIVSAKCVQLKQILDEKIIDCKIFSLQWLSNDMLLLCGAKGHLKIISIIQNGTLQVRSDHILPASRECWVTAATIYKNLMICGDRIGSIHVFRITQDVQGIMTSIHKDVDIKGPLQSFLKIHGKLGVQSCTIVGTKLMTTGRDGTVRFYDLSKTECEKPLCALHAKKMPMDWVSGILQNDNDLYILGFKEIEFIVYSTVLERLLVRLPCGGGHRSWDCMIAHGSINFAYIRDKQINLINCPLYSLSLPAIMNGFHAKETYCIQPLQILNGHNILVSGGEDCTVRVSYITNSSLCDNVCCFTTLNTLNGHISNVKAMDIVNVKNTEMCSENLIFSGGGRAQLKVWKVTVRANRNILHSEDISCIELTSHMLRIIDQRCRKPWQKSNQLYYVDSETRYMDISAHWYLQNTDYVLLFVACSDGCLRILLYNIITNSIQLGASMQHNKRCILKTHSFLHQNELIVLTMATDGTVNFWWLGETVKRILERVKNGNQILIDNTIGNPIAKLNLHQSGINSFDLKLFQANEYLLVTGGDDNQLNLILFRLVTFEDKAMSVETISKWSSTSCHSTQITGVRFDGIDKLYSVGIDQRVLMFTYSYDGRNLSVLQINEIITPVSDVQGLALCYSDKCDRRLLCTYGKGFELINTD